MTLSTFDCIAAITVHSAGFAEAARTDLQAPVAHCPGWSMADLVHHLTEVHWFWATIVEELLDSPPEDARKPARVPDEDLVDVFTSGAGRLVGVLREADQAAACWTWAGWAQHVAFVTRHQVQEASVHHWDAMAAIGGTWPVDAAVAADSIDEFLHFSVASDDDPDDPVCPPLDGTIGFRCSDTGDAWTLRDGKPGTAVVTGGVGHDVPVVEAAAADLLLWLYQRSELDLAHLPADLVARFRGICFTD